MAPESLALASVGPGRILQTLSFGTAMLAAVSPPLLVLSVLMALFLRQALLPFTYQRQDFWLFFSAALIAIPLLVGLWALVMHIVIVSTGEHKRGPGATLTAVVYSSTPLLLLWIPCVAPVLTPFLWTVGAAGALAAVHGISLLRASCAAVAPTALFLAAVLILVLI